MALRAGYKGFKTLGPGLEYDNTTGHLALKGEENPHSLENLSDVSITEPAAEDVLLYDPSEEEWINDDLSNTAAVIAKVDKSDIAPVLSEAVAPEGGLDPNEQFYLYNILYTATTTIAQGTAIVTTGAGQNCKLSDSVTGQIAEKLSYEDNGVLGAKNLLPLSLADLVKINTTGSWNNNVYTLNSVTFTVEVNSDGTVKDIKANGQASATTYFILSADFDTTQYTDMLFNGLPAIGSNDSYVFRVAGQSDWTNIQTFYSNDTVVENNGSNKRLGLRIVNGYNPNNAIFKPMIRLATDTDSTYQPYAQTNRELTVGKTDTTVIGNVEDGATASQAYAVGQGFIRNGQFRVAKGDGVASGGQITDSNSEVKPIADCLFTSLGDIEVSNLNNVPFGMGRAHFAENISPTGGDVYMPFLCFGITTAKVIYTTRVSTGETFVNALHNNTWTGWKQITFVS